MSWFALLLGCSKLYIDGQVVDVSGAPIVGATVTAVGTHCQTNTDDRGIFSLECTPGTYVLAIGQTGYISDENTVDAPEKRRYDIGKRTLIRVPDQDGLFMFERNEYRLMQPGQLVRKKGGKGLDQYKAYCLDEKASAPNLLVAGTYPFFDRNHPGWRPFRLDGRGCAYRMSPKSEAEWVVDYAEKPPFETREVENGKNIILMELAPGDYFIADWENGFFRRLPSDKETFTYAGYWLRVE